MYGEDGKARIEHPLVAMESKAESSPSQTASETERA